MLLFIFRFFFVFLLIDIDLIGFVLFLYFNLSVCKPSSLENKISLCINVLILFEICLKLLLKLVIVLWFLNFLLREFEVLFGDLLLLFEFDFDLLLLFESVLVFLKLLFKLICKEGICFVI